MYSKWLKIYTAIIKKLTKEKLEDSKRQEIINLLNELDRNIYDHFNHIYKDDKNLNLVKGILSRLETLQGILPGYKKYHRTLIDMFSTEKKKLEQESQEAYRLYYSELEPAIDRQDEPEATRLFNLPLLNKFTTFDKCLMGYGLRHRQKSACLLAFSLLKQKGISLDNPPFDSMVFIRNPLLAAIEEKNPSALEALLELGADPNFNSSTKNITDDTYYIELPLYNAAVRSDINMTKLLIAAGAKPSMLNLCLNFNTIILRRKKNHFKIVLLFQLFLDPKLTDRADSRFIDVETCILSRNVDLLDYLLKENFIQMPPSIPKLDYWYRDEKFGSNKQAMFAYCIRLGMLPDQHPINSPLVLKNFQAVEYHINKGTNLAYWDKKNSRISYEQPLACLSAAFSDSKTFGFLVSNGMDMNVKDKDGLTPLHYALKYGNKDTTTLLVFSGANINALDNKKRTPLILAAETLRNRHRSNKKNKPEIIECMNFLIRKGADIKLIDIDEKNVFDYLPNINRNDLLTTKVKQDKFKLPTQTNIRKNPYSLLQITSCYIANSSELTRNLLYRKKLPIAVSEEVEKIILKQS